MDSISNRTRSQLKNKTNDISLDQPTNSNLHTQTNIKPKNKKKLAGNANADIAGINANVSTLSTSRNEDEQMHSLNQKRKQSIISPLDSPTDVQFKKKIDCKYNF
jgi:hypothetical protein